MNLPPTLCIRQKRKGSTRRGTSQNPQPPQNDPERKKRALTEGCGTRQEHSYSNLGSRGSNTNVLAGCRSLQLKRVFCAPDRFAEAAGFDLFPAGWILCVSVVCKGWAVDSCPITTQIGATRHALSRNQHFP